MSEQGRRRKARRLRGSWSWRGSTGRPMGMQEHLDALCPELAAVVADAEKHGNRVRETWRQRRHSAVLLERPRPVLSNVSNKVRAHLTYKRVNDPHYWLGEIHCDLHPGWCVALSFDFASGSTDTDGDHPALREA
jgi:hypothetical protein